MPCKRVRGSSSSSPVRSIPQHHAQIQRQTDRQERSSPVSNCHPFPSTFFIFTFTFIFPRIFILFFLFFWQAQSLSEPSPLTLFRPHPSNLLPRCCRAWLRGGGGRGESGAALTAVRWCDWAWKWQQMQEMQWMDGWMDGREMDLKLGIGNDAETGTEDGGQSGNGRWWVEWRCGSTGVPYLVQLVATILHGAALFRTVENCCVQNGYDRETAKTRRDGEKAPCHYCWTSSATCTMSKNNGQTVTEIRYLSHERCSQYSAADG